jgi:hypothetical protein
MLCLFTGAMHYAVRKKESLLVTIKLERERERKRITTKSSPPIFVTFCIATAYFRCTVQNVTKMKGEDFVFLMGSSDSYMRIFMETQLVKAKVSEWL